MTIFVCEKTDKEILVQVLSKEDTTGKRCEEELDGFLFLKSYTVKASDSLSSSVEYSSVLVKGTSYLIKSCNPPRKYSVVIFDRDRKEVARQDRYNNSNGDKIIFKSNLTSIYYIHYEFKSNVKSSVKSVLAFKRIPVTAASSSM